MEKWKTSISTHKDGDLYVRGKKLLNLIEQQSFVQTVWLLLKAELPSNTQEQMMNALLVAMCEHGVEAPSAFVSRTVASCGNPANAALAAGILCIGEYHGGAIEQCAQLFQSQKHAKEIVSDIVAKGQRMPGYGHKVYKDADPRAQLLFTKAAVLGFEGKYVTLAREVEQELEKSIGMHLPLNIDGAVAALMSELGIGWQYGKSLFILGRLPGLIAHVREEAKEKPYRRLEESDVEYIGPSV